MGLSAGGHTRTSQKHFLRQAKNTQNAFLSRSIHSTFHQPPEFAEKKHATVSNGNTAAYMLKLKNIAPLTVQVLCLPFWQESRGPPFLLKISSIKLFTRQQSRLIVTLMLTCIKECSHGFSQNSHRRILFTSWRKYVAGKYGAFLQALLYLRNTVVFLSPIKVFFAARTLNCIDGFFHQQRC